MHWGSEAKEVKISDGSVVRDRQFASGARPNRSTPHADVFETGGGHLCRTIDVAQIDHEGLPEQLSDPRKVEGAKLVPLRQDDDAVGALEGIIGVVAELDVQKLFCFRVAFGIEDADPRTF